MQADPVDRIFHALGDPTRRAMIKHIGKGPVSASMLAGPLKISLAAVVQHLEVLEESGLIRTEKIGRVRSCRLEPAGFNTLNKWVADHKSMWEKRLDRLARILED